jgi:TRAP-type C4-dicarboxylate transport system permease small subunit
MAFNNRGFLEHVNKVISIVSEVILGAMWVDVFVGVIFRYALNSPLVWTEELSRYLMIWLTFLCASTLMKGWENIRVTVFLEKLPRRISKIIEYIEMIIVCMFLCISWIISIKIFTLVGPREFSPGLGITMFWPQFGIILGLFLMFIQTIGLIIVETKKLKQRKVQ